MVDFFIIYLRGLLFAKNLRMYMDAFIYEFILFSNIKGWTRD